MILYRCGRQTLEDSLQTGADSAVELWFGAQERPARDETAGELLDQLRELAMGTAGSPALGVALYESLRKQLSGSGAREILQGVQTLAETGDPAGARLLGAMLEVVTPAARLLPQIRAMSCSRRLWLSRLAEEDRPGAQLQDWLDRLETLKTRCRDKLVREGRQAERSPEVPGWEAPWGFLRSVTGNLIDRAGVGNKLEPGELELFSDLARLEIDAWQERISHLAGTVDPFRVAAITRLLPILSRADAEIRDLRHLVQLVGEGKLEEAFIHPQLRALTILEAKEFHQLERVLGGEAGLEPLADLLRLQQENPLPVHALAYGAARLMSVGHILQGADGGRRQLDLLGACRLILDHHATGELALQVPAEILPQVTTQLQEAYGWDTRVGCPVPGPEGWPLGGVEILVGQLVVVLPEAGSDFPPWPHFLPTPQDHDPLLASILPALRKADKDAEEAGDEEDVEPNADMAASAMKNLVLTNIQSTSLVLGFLRNPKFVGIPGLVEAVAVRTRNPRVIEVIAVDRTLHTGFANRGVALACLRSPVNVSVKTLRKFIHVKFISKIDLKRLVQDRAGIRKEVLREIEKYLEALA